MCGETISVLRNGDKIWTCFEMGSKYGSKMGLSFFNTCLMYACGKYYLKRHRKEFAKEIICKRNTNNL